MIDYNQVVINHTMDDLFVSVNDIYEQYDEGRIDYNDAQQILMRVCKNFMQPDSMRDCNTCNARTEHIGSVCVQCNSPQPDRQVSHSIKFDDVDAMVLWLLENDVDNTPVTLTIHLGE